MVKRTLGVMLLGLGLCAVSATMVTAAPAKSGSKAPEVVMYATRTCGYCVKARAYLKGQGVAWQERDIEVSAQANREWLALGGVGTPVIVINGTPIIGFMQAKIDEELARTGK